LKFRHESTPEQNRKEDAFFAGRFLHRRQGWGIQAAIAGRAARIALPWRPSLNMKNLNIDDDFHGNIPA